MGKLKKQETKKTMAATSNSVVVTPPTSPPASISGVIPPSSDYYRLLKWYGLLALVGLGIAALCWSLFPVIGMTTAIILLSSLALAAAYGFYRFNRDWFRKTKNYPRTAPFAIAVGVPLVAFMVMMSSGMGLIVPALFLAPFLFRSVIAGLTYVTRLMDLYKDTNRVKEKQQADQTKIAKFDFWMMVGGTILSIVVIALTAVADNIAHISTIGFFGAHFFALIAGVGSLGGLFHRPVGNGRMPVETWTMRCMFVLALIAAVLICSLGLIPAIAATGLMTAGLIGIPFYLFFVPSFVSACVSFSDYVLKTSIYVLKLLGNPTYEKYIKESSKEHEYRGATIGMLIGLTLGIVLISLMVAQPQLFGILLIAKSLGGKIILGLLMGGAVSATGSRIGKSLEGVPSSASAENKTLTTPEESPNLKVDLLAVEKEAPCKDALVSPKAIKSDDADPIPPIVVPASSKLEPSETGCLSSLYKWMMSPISAYPLAASYASTIATVPCSPVVPSTPTDAALKSF